MNTDFAIHILSALGFMGGLGILLAVVLAVANRKFHVDEDPRIDDVEELLPKANCGACGFPGCRPFAESCVKGDSNPAQCTVNSSASSEFIARLLGVELGKAEKKVARLACAGGNHVARMRSQYTGLGSCRAAVAAGGGGKACSWGCLGLGDCDVSCDFDAITMDRHGLPVVDEEKCVACNDCVEACPLDLFSLQPVSHKLWVACKNLLEGERALEDCDVACTGCARCAADAPGGLIEIRNNLAVIDYAKNRLATPLAIQRCPTGAIVWLEKNQASKGQGTRKVVRQEPLPIESDF